MPRLCEFYGTGDEQCHEPVSRTADKTQPSLVCWYGNKTPSKPQGDTVNAFHPSKQGEKS